MLQILATKNNHKNVREGKGKYYNHLDGNNTNKNYPLTIKCPSKNKKKTKGKNRKTSWYFCLMDCVNHRTYLICIKSKSKASGVKNLGKILLVRTTIGM